MVGREGGGWPQPWWKSFTGNHPLDIVVKGGSRIWSFVIFCFCCAYFRPWNAKFNVWCTGFGFWFAFLIPDVRGLTTDAVVLAADARERARKVGGSGRQPLSARDKLWKWSTNSLRPLSQLSTCFFFLAHFSCLARVPRNFGGLR